LGEDGSLQHISWRRQFAFYKKFVSEKKDEISLMRLLYLFSSLNCNVRQSKQFNYSTIHFHNIPFLSESSNFLTVGDFLVLTQESVLLGAELYTELFFLKYHVEAKCIYRKWAIITAEGRNDQMISTNALLLQRLFLHIRTVSKPRGVFVSFVWSLK
jgi:hypothetical protein